MPLRPNPQRTVADTKRLAEDQQIRLRDMITSVEATLAQQNLSPGEVAQYKQYISVATKQFKTLSQIIALPMPEITLAGAPAPVAVTQPSTDAPPKRKPGRPPKSAVQEQVGAAPAVANPAPARRPGRPPKNPVAPVATASPAVPPPAAGPAASHSPSVTAPVNSAAISDAPPVKRGPGRPKGSKNKPKVLNGLGEAHPQP